MKTQIKRAMVVFVATAMIALAGSHLAWSQDGRPAIGNAIGVPVDSAEAVPEDAPLTAPSVFAFPTGSAFATPVLPTERPARAQSFQQRYQQAVTVIRDAEDPEAKSDATKQLAVVLGEYFERDINAREQELAKIEARVKKLRDQLSIRQEKKEEIIDLQVRVAINEAEGLGFFRGSGGGEDPFSDGSMGGMGMGGFRRTRGGATIPHALPTKPSSPISSPRR